MKTHKLKIISEHFIAGRGKIFMISLKENKFDSKNFRHDSEYVNDSIELLDQFTYEGKKYSIIGIEYAKQLFGVADTISLLVKEIEKK